MPMISIAPMLDWSDKHYRYFMRQITPSATLYTEMIVADAIIHGNKERLLAYNEEEHPVVLQLGGSDPKKLANASKIATKYGYDEINLNVGCPSDRVKSGNFGACLMDAPDLVASCVRSMQDSVDIPITVKHRIGLDYNEGYDFVSNFVAIVAAAGCKHFIVHARNAILKGLSPKENREVPPLKYEYVYKLQQDFPDLSFTLNGGVKTLDEIKKHLQLVTGVMLGREAYYNPYLFAEIENMCSTDNRVIDAPSRKDVALRMLPYLIKTHDLGVPLHHATRHMIGLYHGCPHAKLWRTTLTNEMIKNNNVVTYEKLLNSIE